MKYILIIALLAATSANAWPVVGGPVSKPTVCKPNTSGPCIPPTR